MGGDAPPPPPPTPRRYVHLGYDVHHDGRVALLTLDRPAKMNCINAALHRELCQAFDAANLDERVRVIVLTGAGREAFCSGADLTEGHDLAPMTEDDVLRSNRGEFVGMIGPTRRTDIDKPVIAAVNGVAYAGGFEWALFADIVVADEHATFGVTCRRWNVGLGDGGTQRLPRKIGLSRALDLILTGRVIDAREAHAMGIAARVVPSGECVRHALSLAAQLSDLPQPAMLADRRAAVHGLGLPLDEGLLLETRCFNASFHADGGSHTLEGLRRFAQRDHPERKRRERDGEGSTGSPRPGGVRRSRL